MHEILGVFCNTLTANDKYPLPYCENFSSPIQMQLSLKPNTFFHSFVPFLESTLNIENIKKKDDPHSYFISEITDCERLAYCTL